jgi:hypothetical protein
VTVNGSTLNVNGNGANDTITVHEDVGSVHVEYTDAQANLITTDVGGITAIRINGGGGSDTINYFGNSIGADIHGGDGQTSGDGDGDSHKNDRGKGHQKAIGRGHHKGGSDDNADGAAGDFITVSDDGTGSSTVHGDDGDDTITLLHGNNTQIFGDAGDDQIYVNTAATGGSANVNAGSGNDTITIYDGTNTVNGGTGNDTVLEDVPASDPGDLSGGGNVNPALQTLISIEHVETF